VVVWWARALLQLLAGANERQSPWITVFLFIVAALLLLHFVWGMMVGFHALHKKREPRAHHRAGLCALIAAGVE
jgi:hypothetical protein